MISNDINEKLTIARLQMAHGIDLVEKGIGDLSRRELRRLVRFITHLHVAKEVLGQDFDEITEKEGKIIDDIFATQEAIMGYVALDAEFKKETGAFTRAITQENDNE